MSGQAKIKLLAAILDRGQGEKAAELFAAEGLRLLYGVPGKGTASSEMLDYLGLGETEKELVLALLPDRMARPLLRELESKLQLSKPGKGIIFTVPLSAIGGAVARFVDESAQGRRTEQEDTMETQEKNDLILVVADSAGHDAVMIAARRAGARGGTLLHGHRLGEEGESGLHPEKDIIAILAPRSQLRAIMEAVHREAHGVVLSLPVEEVSGLSQME